jgi:hypothetical protein
MHGKVHVRMKEGEKELRVEKEDFNIIEQQEALLHPLHTHILNTTLRRTHELTRRREYITSSI